MVRRKALRSRMTYQVNKAYAVRGVTLSLCIAFLLGQLLLAQKASVTFDDQYRFSDHKRYAWLENRLMTRQHPDTNEVMDLKIVKAVNQVLAARGFAEVKDKEKPDFYVRYDGGGNSQFLAGGQTQASSAPLAPSDPTPTYG